MIPEAVVKITLNRLIDRLFLKPDFKLDCKVMAIISEFFPRYRLNPEISRFESLATEEYLTAMEPYEQFYGTWVSYYVSQIRHS